MIDDRDLLMPAHQLPQWFARDEIKTSGTWTVREHCDDVIAFLVAFGTRENMMMLAAMPDLCRIAAKFITSREPDVIWFKRQMIEILKAAGVRAL